MLLKAGQTRALLGWVVGRCSLCLLLPAVKALLRLCGLCPGQRSLSLTALARPSSFSPTGSQQQKVLGLPGLPSSEAELRCL